jgi:hypothetical protein
LEAIMNMKSAISLLLLTQMLTQPAPFYRAFPFQKESSHSKVLQSIPQCDIAWTPGFIITCVFGAAAPTGTDSRAVPRIVLNRAVISFVPSDESHMRVELSFTNDSGGKISDQRTVYLAIDDDKGENHMRRSLPHVDFTKLESGKPAQFQETLLAPAFAPGTYIVSLWIPSSDPSLKFDPANNFLLSSADMADPVTGLNRIAKFTVAASAKPKRSGAPD